MENNISEYIGGLNQDSSPINQPKGTYRFALNSVNETELGDFGFISNEESTEPCGNISQGFIPIGKVYIGENRTIIFSVSEDNTTSEIGMLYNCEYISIVND